MTTESNEPVYGGYGFGELPEPRHTGDDDGLHHRPGSDLSEYSGRSEWDFGGQPAAVLLARTLAQRDDDYLTRYEKGRDAAVAERPVQERSARDTPGSEVRFRHHDGSNLSGTWARQVLEGNDRWRHGFLDLP